MPPCPTVRCRGPCWHCRTRFPCEDRTHLYFSAKLDKVACVMSRPSSSHGGRLVAVLGPTNTGKTHYAVERMLGHASGMIGFPLRLLAREVYDRVVKIKGPTRVALITGEEKITPANAAYTLCTVEAMPMDREVAFLAVDEIQMAADPQRGHVFTDRLLRARGREETLFMGADTIRPLIARLLPDADILTRPRFSDLKYVRPVKLTRLPRRSAVVAFSAGEVYAIAELIRRQRGGAALVMGALSPRTRNAQVALYQAGEVDYLVATDAIGMGLNMDIDHVAFAGLEKFDGRLVRPLAAAEVGQIAGRAGRHMNDGSFSTLAGDGRGLDPLVVGQVESHRFAPLKVLQWRNAALDFGSPGRLIRSLEEPTSTPGLHRAREALDLTVLKALARDPDIACLAAGPAAVRRLWDVCQIPDFRKISDEDHIALLGRIYRDLMGPDGVIPHDWIARQVSRLDNVQGDIDTLAGRIASIRIWTYVAHRRDWLEDAAHWAHAARGVEDKLSDALHDRLTQRFVDRRTSVLMRELRKKGELTVEIDDTNQVTVEGKPMGRLDGFSFRADPDADRSEQRSLEAAADQALKAEIARRVKIFANVGYKTLALDFAHGLGQPRLMWEGAPVATVTKGADPLKPRVRLVADSLLSGPLADQVTAKMQDWLEARLDDKLAPLMTLARELAGAAPPEGAAPLDGMCRGAAFQLIEALGALPRDAVADTLRQIDQDARRGLRRHGVRIGATALYMPALLKPHAVELRLMLWAMTAGRDELPPVPTPGMVWCETADRAPHDFYWTAGFRPVGRKAIRIDMLERLADGVRPLGKDGKTFEVSPELMGLVGVSGDDFIEVMTALGYAHEKRQVAPEATAEPAAPAEEAAEPAPAAPTDTGTDTGTDTDGADGQTAPADVEKLFFSWKPRPRPRRRARQQDGERKARGPAAERGRKDGGRKPARRDQPRGPAKAPRRDEYDKDSPFAALADLKDALQKREPSKPRAQKTGSGGSA